MNVCMYVRARVHACMRVYLYAYRVLVRLYCIKNVSLAGRGCVRHFVLDLTVSPMIATIN